MSKEYKESFWDKLRDVLSHVNIKASIYGILTLGVLIMILMNVTGDSKYGHLDKNGKFVLDINSVARDYGLDINNETDPLYVDYVNDRESSLTNDLSSSLFLTNLYLEQNGITDPRIRGKILADIILNYKDQVSGRKYTEENLDINRLESEASVSEYYTEIKTLFDKYALELKQTETAKPDITAGNTGNIENADIQDFKKQIDTYIYKLTEVNQLLINELLKISATKEGSVYQLQIINLFEKENAFLKSLSQIETDPAKYFLGEGEDSVNNFEKELSEIEENFSIYFKRFGITN